VVITSGVAAVLALLYRSVCAWENRKRDKAGTAEAFEHAYEDDLTDKTVCFNHSVSFFTVPLGNLRLLALFFCWASNVV
jgi:hypothetical protein